MRYIKDLPAIPALQSEDVLDQLQPVAAKYAFPSSEYYLGLIAPAISRAFPHDSLYEMGAGPD